MDGEAGKHFGYTAVRQGLGQRLGVNKRRGVGKRYFPSRDEGHPSMARFCSYELSLNCSYRSIENGREN